MPRTEKYTCDVCGAEKKETNHWMVAAAAGYQMTLGPFNDAREFEQGGYALSYLCGEKCASTLVSRWAEKLRSQQ